MKNLDVRASIRAVCDEVQRMLLAKNRAYGNSALAPLRVFSRADPVEQLNVRIDDKLSRVAQGSEYADDDTELDLIGYLVLRRVARRAPRDRAGMASDRNPRSLNTNRTLRGVPWPARGPQKGATGMTAAEKKAEKAMIARLIGLERRSPDGCYPVLAAVRRRGGVGWKVWCRYCNTWHFHGEGEGHRVADCFKASPYTSTGYIFRNVEYLEAWVAWWTPERLVHLAADLAAGRSAQQVAAQIRRDFKAGRTVGCPGLIATQDVRAVAVQHGLRCVPCQTPKTSQAETDARRTPCAAPQTGTAPTQTGC